MTTAYLVNFAKHDGWYSFNFKAKGEDFNEALSILKTISLADRTFNEDTKIWSVRVGPFTDQVLVRAFKNGQSCITMVNAQLAMF